MVVMAAKLASLEADDLAYLTKPRNGPSHIDKGLNRLTVQNLELQEKLKKIKIRRSRIHLRELNLLFSAHWCYLASIMTLNKQAKIHCSSL